VKRAKVFTLLVIIVLNIFLLSGCWNYREIEDLAIVSGLAVDKGRTEGTYLVTFEIVDFRGGDKEDNIKSEKVEAEGKTIFDAVRNAIRISARRLFWSHADIAIISQDVAREGIIQLIDFINRDAEPREQMQILISKEKTAKELLEHQSLLTDIQSFELEKAIAHRESYSKTPGAHVHDVINMLAGDGIALSLPAVGTVINNGRKVSEISGMAMFHEDKLIGILNGENTKYFLFVKDEINRGLLTLNEVPERAYDDITLEISENNTKVTSLISYGKITMNIDIKTKVSIAEVDISKNVIDEKGRKNLKTTAEQMLKTNIENVIKLVQEDYGVDVFGFGDTIKKENPELWKSIGGDWSTMFKKIKTNVYVEMEIISSGQMAKPIKIGGS